MKKNDYKEQRKQDLMQKCFECFCKNGLAGTSMRMLAESAGISVGNMYTYFKNMDQLVIETTGYCMAKVEDEFMELAPKNLADVERFLHEVPYWTAKNHGDKYCFMYQVYTSPQYRKYGKEFFKGVELRYTEYAKQLEPLIGIPWQIVQPLIFTFVRASVHYAMFDEEEYLKSQIRLIGETCLMMYEKYNGKIQEQS